MQLPWADLTARLLVLAARLQLVAVGALQRSARSGHVEVDTQ